LTTARIPPIIQSVGRDSEETGEMSNVERFVEYVQCEITESFSEKYLRTLYAELNEDWELARAEVLIASGNHEVIFAESPELAYKLGYEVPGYVPPKEAWEIELGL
jgi:hypothetical protein